MAKRKVRHHLETSPTVTFRVVEEEGEEEVQWGTAEEPTNPRIGEGARILMKRNIRTGMLHSQLDPVRVRRLKKMSHGGTKTIATTVSPRRNLRIEIPLGTLPEIMKIEIMKKGKEQEAQVLEVRDIIEGTEAWIDRVVEETTMMIEESIEVDIILVEENIAQIDRTEENTAQIDRTEEITAPDTDKIDKTADLGTEEITHLKKAEGTLVTIDEGDAKGPLVMEGPLQASP